MLAVISIGSFMIVVFVGFGRYHYTTGMPLAGSCSLAISAACLPEQHSEPGNVLSEQKLQWGVNSGRVKGVCHCTFSPKVVGRLKREASMLDWLHSLDLGLVNPVDKEDVRTVSITMVVGAKGQKAILSSNRQCDILPI